MNRCPVGIAALAAAVIALGLAVLPAIVLDRPLPNPFAGGDPPPPPARDIPEPEAEPEPKPEVTLKYKKFSLALSKRKKGEQPKDQDEVQDVPAMKPTVAGAAPAVIAQAAAERERDRTLKWFHIAAVCCSLVGLVLGPISWTREKQPGLAGPAIGISCLAIAWQYVAVGIAVGVAVAVLLYLVLHFF